MSVKRRKRLAQLAGEYDFMVLEDDPYRDIRYSGEALPPIKAFDTTNHVILAGSFSKIFSPGSRLGYAVATKEIIAKMADGQMCTNVHSPMESQVLAAEFFNRGYFPEHLKRVCTLYKERRDAMGHLWYINYSLVGEKDKYLQIATTRPETIPGDTAVAVNPKDERYGALVGKKVLLPTTNREIPIIADDYVDLVFGTGAVKITPAHVTADGFR